MWRLREHPNASSSSDTKSEEPEADRHRARRLRGTDVQVSLTTALTSLSSRRPTYLAWRRCFPSVHSRNSNWATTSGLTQRHSLIFFAVSPAPHRPAFASDSRRRSHGANVSNRYVRAIGRCGLGTSSRRRRNIRPQVPCRSPTRAGRRTGRDVRPWPG